MRGTLNNKPMTPRPRTNLQAGSCVLCSKPSGLQWTTRLLCDACASNEDDDVSIDPVWRVTTETETREFSEIPPADVITEMAGFHQTSTGCMGGCVAVPAFRKQRSGGLISVRIETVAPVETSGRDSSAYLHGVDVATKAIELRDAKPPKPQTPHGRIIRG